MSSKSQRTIYSGFLGLSLLPKESQIKTARSDMYKGSKETGRVNSLSHKMCVSIQQHFLILIQQHWDFGIEFKAAFVFLGICVRVSACLKPRLRYRFSLRSTLTSSIFSAEDASLFRLSDSFTSQDPGRAYPSSFHSFKSFKLLDHPVRFLYSTDHLMSWHYLLTDSSRFLFHKLVQFGGFQETEKLSLFFAVCCNYFPC